MENEIWLLDDVRKARHDSIETHGAVIPLALRRRTAPPSNMQRLISGPLSSVPQQEMRQDGWMIQSEMLAQLRRNGASGSDRQDRRFVCKDGVGCGGGGWLEMAYRTKNFGLRC